MKAKKYLQQLKRLDELINQKIKEVTDLRERATSVSGIDYSKDKVQSSPSGDAPFVKPICRIIDLEAEINAEIDKFVDEKHKIINQIQGLKNSDYIALLFKRYVEYKSLERICVEMNFSYDYIKHLHGYALKDFEDRILNTTPNNT